MLQFGWNCLLSLVSIFHFSTQWVLLFWYLLCRMVSIIMLNTLGYKRQCKESRLRNEWKVRLIEWRKAYLVIGELVDKINSCFGPVMLISLISMFARVIKGSFFLILTLNSWKFESSITFEVTNLVIILTVIAIHNVALLYVAHGMRKKVISQCKSA